MGKKIYIVEDDESIQDMLKIILEKAGYEITVYSQGTGILKDDYLLPDIFLLDRQLPDMDGLDICRFLKSKEDTRDIPVVMISANPHIDELSKNAGADGYIEKPFSINLLLKTIRTFLQRQAPENVVL